MLDPIDEENRVSTVEEQFSAMSNKLMDMISRSSPRGEDNISHPTTNNSREYQRLTVLPTQHEDIVIVSEDRSLLHASIN